MADAAYIALTLVCFAALALLVDAIAVRTDRTDRAAPGGSGPAAAPGPRP
jgi:hypothetical protein